MILDAALLNTQHYKIRIKSKLDQSREWSSALPCTPVSILITYFAQICLKTSRWECKRPFPSLIVCCLLNQPRFRLYETQERSELLIWMNLCQQIKWIQFTSEYVNHQFSELGFKEDACFQFCVIFLRTKFYVNILFYKLIVSSNSNKDFPYTISTKAG